MQAYLYKEKSSIRTIRLTQDEVSDTPVCKLATPSDWALSILMRILSDSRKAIAGMG